MIVISFTPSYSLLAYLFQILGTVCHSYITWGGVWTHLCSDTLCSVLSTPPHKNERILILPAQFSLLNVGTISIKAAHFCALFSHRHNLQIINLEAVT